VRVITGRLKGRRLAAPTWTGLRPTSDRLRETFFNIVAGRVEGARVLDAYAGTGAVGIEALSRGAAHVTFVERDARALRLIERNLAACGVQQGYTIDRAAMPDALRRYPDAAFDLVWLDPPYDSTDVGETLDAAARVVRTDGLVVLERAARRDPVVPDALTRTRDVKAGDSTLTFFVRRTAAGPATGHSGET
jgi:16S rRNA (guanine(966)-N(2))-methyltransferase RsmD